MKIQMTRSDWENSGPYDSLFFCPGATMMTRIIGVQMVSMSSTRYETKEGDDIYKTTDKFTTTEYDEAERRYNAGEEILFETELIEPQ